MSLEELKQYPKIKNVFTLGTDGQFFIAETNEIYLYTEDRNNRSKMGSFVIFLAPDRITIKNDTPFHEAKRMWTTSSGPSQGSNHGNWVSGDLLHHPHVPGNYVSLAAHEKPLLEAIEKQDWSLAMNIVFKFLSDYKHGDKAKKFFQRQMETKNQKTGQWEEVDFDDSFFDKSDFAWSSTTTYTSGTSDKKMRIIQATQPVGTRVRLEYTNAHNSGVEEGDEGVINGYSVSSLDVKWDNGGRLTLLPSTDRWEVVELPEGFTEEDAKVAEAKIEDEGNHSPECRKLKPHQPKGTKIRMTSNANANFRVREGMTGTIDYYTYTGPYVILDSNEESLAKVQLSARFDEWEVVELPEGFTPPIEDEDSTSDKSSEKPPIKSFSADSGNSDGYEDFPYCWY